MPIKTPADVHAIFERAFNAADRNALLDMYEPNGKLIPSADHQAQGREAIRAAMEQFLALKGTMRISTVYTIESGDLAVTRGHWTLSGGTDPQGNPITLQGESIEVLRRQPGGGWLVVIDHPFGAAGK